MRMRYFLLFLVATLYTPVQAEEGATNIQNNPYFVSLLQIGLQKEQADRFKLLLNDYAADRGNVIDRQRRKNEPDLPGRIKQAHRKIQNRFIARMEKLLDDDQFGRFPVFHGELDKILAEREVLTEINDPHNIFPDRE